MSLYYQIYTGSGAGRNITRDKILNRLPESNYLDSLIVGWSENTDIYRELRYYTKQEGIKLWLWYPVFSEHATQGEFHQQVNIRTGEPFGAKVFDGDETFDFCCPSQARIPDELLTIYDDIYSAGEFDGVFLDRIRYPSMTMGLEALFGCSCEDCLAWFETKGLPKAEIAACYGRLERRIEDQDCDNPMGIESYQNGTYTFSDPVLSKLLILRCERISSILQELSDGFRKRELLVGMDLFAPFLSTFVGQDYLALGAMSDFAKPMLYRNTYTPAGIFFELDAMAKALSGGNAQTFQRRRSFLQEVLGLHGNGMTFLRRELDALRYFSHKLRAEDRFIPGIEIHTVRESPPVCCNSIRETVRTLEEAGFQSRVACWDILCADDSALKAFAGFSGGEQLE